MITLKSVITISLFSLSLALLLTGVLYFVSSMLASWNRKLTIIEKRIEKVASTIMVLSGIGVAVIITIWVMDGTK